MEDKVNKLIGALLQQGSLLAGLHTKWRVLARYLGPALGLSSGLIGLGLFCGGGIETALCSWVLSHAGTEFFG
jgi:hypothetical protein